MKTKEQQIEKLEKKKESLSKELSNYQKAWIRAIGIIFVISIIIYSIYLVMTFKTISKEIIFYSFISFFICFLVMIVSKEISYKILFHDFNKTCKKLEELKKQ